MHPDKSRGPHGMNLGFYQRFWDIMGKDVITACLYYLNFGTFPETLNENFIVLIAKINHPVTLSDMRPISFCDVIYKIMSEVIANRLEMVLH